MGKVLPNCFICEQVPDEGIAQGIVIFKKFLCDKCQTQILDVTNEDSEYQYILGKIKELWETHPKERAKLLYQTDHLLQ